MHELVSMHKSWTRGQSMPIGRPTPYVGPLSPKVLHLHSYKQIMTCTYGTNLFEPKSLLNCLLSPKKDVCWWSWLCKYVMKLPSRQRLVCKAALAWRWPPLHQRGCGTRSNLPIVYVNKMPLAVYNCEEVGHGVAANPGERRRFAMEAASH